MAAVLAAAAILLAFVTYRGLAGRGRVRDRVVLTVLRIATLCLMLFLLFRPILVVKAAVVFVVMLLQSAEFRGALRGWVQRRPLPRVPT